MARLAAVVGRVRKCEVEGCGRSHLARGYCGLHYKRWRATGSTDSRFTESCSVAGCERQHRAEGLCGLHHGRKVAGWSDLEVRPTRRAERWLSDEGYVRVVAPGHPNADSTGRIMEHRLVMTNLLGRPLLWHENVHHLNGDRSDNRIENLELWTRSQPPGQRVADKVVWAKEILAVYEPTSLR